MRARVEGKIVANFHIPATPATSRPTVSSVCNRPMRNSVNGAKPARLAHPVGLASVAPAPVPFQPDTNESSSRRGLRGNGRNSPTAGTPSVKKARLPIRSPASTQNHTMTGPVVPSRHRRTVTSCDT